MKKWDVWLAARYKSGAVDDEIEEVVAAKDFEEAYRKALRTAGAKMEG